MQRWNVGSVTVTRINELAAHRRTLVGLIPAATPDAVRAIPWLAPAYADAEGVLKFHSHVFVIDTGDVKIVVDTGVGNDKTVPLLPDWQKLDTDFLESFGDAGYDPADIDYVVCTHMHFDHVGWNTSLVNGNWVPTFPNARYIVEREDYDELVRFARAPGGVVADVLVRTLRALIAESIEPVESAGLLDLVDSAYEVVRGVRLMSTPGHTKGHVSVRIGSGDAEAIITGDLFHHPVQVARPTWSSDGDYDPAATAATRQLLLESVVDTPTLLLGTHWSGTSAGRVTRDGDTFRLVS